MKDPPFAIGDHVLCTYRKTPRNQATGIVYGVHYSGTCFGWIVKARGWTRTGKPAVYSWLASNVVRIATSAQPDE